MKILNTIKSDDFLVSIGYDLPTKAMRHVMLGKEEIINEFKNQYNETDIKEFVDNLLKELKIGESFSYNMTISFICVCLEEIKTDFANEFLFSLSNLKLTEMRPCIEMAKLCIENRN